jgi:hypothetical protein
LDSVLFFFGSGYRVAFEYEREFGGKRDRQLLISNGIKLCWGEVLEGFGVSE